MKEEMSETEKRKCGCFFTPFAELQRKAIIENLNKSSDEEALKKSRLIERLMERR